MGNVERTDGERGADGWERCSGRRGTGADGGEQERTGGERERTGGERGSGRVGNAGADGRGTLVRTDGNASVRLGTWSRRSVADGGI